MTSDANAPTGSGLLTVTKTGGLAGVLQERSVALADLPADERRAWLAALRDRDLLDLDGAEAWPDSFCYGITCTGPLVDVQVPEHAMPPLLLELVDRLLGGP